MSKVFIEPKDLSDKEMSDGFYKIFLLNDDVNSMEHVVFCLISALDYDPSVAFKIAVETHLNGRSLIQTNEKDKIVTLRTLLEHYGLKSEVVKV